MVRLLLVCVLLSITICCAHGSFRVVQTIQGGNGDPVYGDLFGVPLDIDAEGNLFVGALYADGELFPNGTAMERAGKTFFYKKEGETYRLSEVYTGQSAYNQNSGTSLRAGITSTRLRGTTEWLFDPEAGTPLNVSDPDVKDRSGNINVFKRQGNAWVIHQRIPNPDGHGPDQNHEEYGINIDFTESGGGWLVVGGGITNKAWFVTYDEETDQWVNTQNVITGALKGNLIVAIGGEYAFIQVATDFSTISNLEVLVYKRHGSRWEYHQTLNGIGNTGPNMSFIGDLFGSPMTIDGSNAVIGAPGDSQANPGGYNLPGASYFLRLKNGWWTITDKVFSDQPTLFFGFGNCMDGDTAVIADTGRTVNGNPFQGGLRLYHRHGGRWVPGELLVDPDGRAFDYFSVCSIGGSSLAGASFRAATQFLGAGIGESLPGRVVVWDWD